MSSSQPLNPNAAFFRTALYLDLEFTCWNAPPPPGIKQEIIEVGVVALDLQTLKITDEATYFVKPRRWDISVMCTRLTGITDDDIRKASSLEEVLSAITKRFTPQGKPCCAWGQDFDLLARTCVLKSLKNPFRSPIDLSIIVRGAFALKEQLSLRNAVKLLELDFVGFEHGALPDARNLALLHAELLRRLRVSSVKPVAPETPATTASALSPFAQKLAMSLPLLRL